MHGAGPLFWLRMKLSRHGRHGLRPERFPGLLCIRTGAVLSFAQPCEKIKLFLAFGKRRLPSVLAALSDARRAEFSRLTGDGAFQKQEIADF